MICLPDFNYERELWEKGYLVIGVDEVGRGAIAGPIFAAAIAFKSRQRKNKKQITRHKQNLRIKDQKNTYLSYTLHASRYKTVIINDSKKLNENQRQVSYQWLVNNCLGFSQASSSVDFINKYGVQKANIRAMRLAVIRLLQKLKPVKKAYVLSDYYSIPYLKNITKKHQSGLKKGDQISYSIASASIIAKVNRDWYMKAISWQFPNYLWHKNKGYGTKKHFERIRKFGVTKHHRKKFINNFLSQK